MQSPLVEAARVEWSSRRSRRPGSQDVTSHEYTITMETSTISTISTITIITITRVQQQAVTLLLLAMVAQVSSALFVKKRNR